MKIKKLVGALIALGTMFVATNVYAATTVKFGDITKDKENEYIDVPVIVESSVYDSIQAIQAEITVPEGLTYADATTSLKYLNTKTNKYVAGLGPASVNDTDPTKLLFAWSTSSDKMGVLAKSPNAFVLHFSDEGQTITKEQFGIKVQAAVLYDTEDDIKTELNDASEEFAVYATASVPKTVPDDWSFGYIQSMKAVITDQVNTSNTTEVELVNCVETADSYLFVVKIIPTEQTLHHTVEVKFVAGTSDTMNAEKTTWKETDYSTSTVVLESVA